MLLSIGVKLPFDISSFDIFFYIFYAPPDRLLRKIAIDKANMTKFPGWILNRCRQHYIFWFATRAEGGFAITRVKKKVFPHVSNKILFRNMRKLRFCAHEVFFARRVS